MTQVSRIALRRCSQNVIVIVIVIPGLLLGGVLEMSSSLSLSLSIFLVISCLLIRAAKSAGIGELDSSIAKDLIDSEGSHR